MLKKLTHTRLGQNAMGRMASLPVLAVLTIGFFGPLVLVVLFSFMPANSFSIFQTPTMENYASVFSNSYYLSFLWSFAYALATTVLLLLICFPTAYGLAKVFGLWAPAITAIIAVPILISENIRLFGWVLLLVKNGVIDGVMKSLFGVSLSGMLYTPEAILLGTCYVYLPFMLFPLSAGIAMIPEALKEAAFDLGASRIRVFWEVEVPIAMPGILIGSILTFVLTLGALIESKLLGGQSVILVTDDIETAFTFAQNWPKGSVLSVLLIGISAIIVFFVLKYVDLDRLMGRR